jgi:hypothetical protein
MTIKRTTLITLIVVVIIVALGASFAINNHIKERNKQHDIDEYFEYIEKQTEQEYQSLKYEYLSYVNTIMDNEYSSELKAKYVRKVNKLLDEYIYEYGTFNYETVFNFMNTQPSRQNEDLKILRKLAEERVFQD